MSDRTIELAELHEHCATVETNAETARTFYRQTAAELRRLAEVERWLKESRETLLDCMSQAAEMCGRDRDALHEISEVRERLRELTE